VIFLKTEFLTFSMSDSKRSVADEDDADPIPTIKTNIDGTTDDTYYGNKRGSATPKKKTPVARKKKTSLEAARRRIALVMSHGIRRAAPPPSSSSSSTIVKHEERKESKMDERQDRVKDEEEEEEEPIENHDDDDGEEESEISSSTEDRIARVVGTRKPIRKKRRVSGGTEVTVEESKKRLTTYKLDQGKILGKKPPTSYVAKTKPRPRRVTKPVTATVHDVDIGNVLINNIHDLIISNPSLRTGIQPTDNMLLSPSEMMRANALSHKQTAAAIAEAAAGASAFQMSAIPSSASSISSSSSSIAANAELHNASLRDPEDPLMIPKPTSYIVNAMNKLVRPAYLTVPTASGAIAHKPEDDQVQEEKDHKTALITGILELRKVKASYETRLLAEAGTTFTAANGKQCVYPACMGGEKDCIGFSGLIRTGPKTTDSGAIVIDNAPYTYLPVMRPGTAQFMAGVAPHHAIKRVLTRFMWEEQYERMMTTGEMPDGEMRCVLCYRMNVGRLLQAARGAKSKVISIQGEYINIYQNISGIEGEYMDSCVNKQQGARYEPLKGCLAMFRRSVLYWTRINGRWVVNQDLMIVSKPRPVYPMVSRTLE
jgi:predicted DCC family thiol-disulfide oxidoreductase YuxK